MQTVLTGRMQNLQRSESGPPKLFHLRPVITYITSMVATMHMRLS